MINVGIIGFGKMGQIRYDTIADSPRGRVIAIAEPDNNRVLNNDVPLVSIEEIIHSKRIDAVFICTPNHLNKELTIRALQAGKHVFCEKPPAFTVAEMEEIMGVERETAGLKLMYGFNHRHHESIIKVKELIDSRKYGHILWMRGRYGKSVDKTFFENWRAKREFAGGGILLDQGIHMLDLFLYFANDFDEVKSFVSNSYWNLDIEDNVFAIMRNSTTNVTASLHSTMTQWRHLFSLEIFCEKGYMVLNGLKTSSKTYGDEILSVAKNRTTAPAATWEDEEKLYFEVDNSWRIEVDHFFHCIKTGLPVSKGHSGDALKVMRAIERIYQDSIVDYSSAAQTGAYVDHCGVEGMEYPRYQEDREINRVGIYPAN